MNKILKDNLAEYKETNILLSQAQVRLKSLLREVEAIIDTITIAKQKEEQRIREDNYRAKRLLECLFGNSYERHEEK